MAVIEDKLSIREQIAVAELIKGQTAENALRTAGYAESTCKTGHYNVLQKPRIQNVMREALERAGVTPDKLAEVCFDGLKADRPIVVDKSLIDYPDHGARHRFLETCVKLSGLEPASDLDISAESYESRIMSIVAASQPIDIPAIADESDNCCTIIEAKATVPAPQGNNNDKDRGDPDDAGISYDI